MTDKLEVKKMPCVVCGKQPSDRAHIKTRGAGATWEDFEWVYLCRRHHQEQGTIGILTFYFKYGTYQNAVKEKGWVLENGKFWNELLSKRN